MTVIPIETGRRDADRYANIDCMVLDCTRLADLAVAVHGIETDEADKISSYGPTADLILRQLQIKLHAIVDQLWD